MYFDRKIFFLGVRSSFGKLTQKQVNGLNRLVEAIESDPHVKDVRWAAYMLATSYHETAHTFHPIHEYGTRQYFIKRYGGQTRKGKELGNDTPEEGYHYAGKGDVQLTGESNYERAEKALRKEYPELIAKWEAATGKTFDLTVGDQPNDEDDPKNIMHPEISYAVMSYGMRSGMFTSKTLSDYIKGSTCDYKGARKIVNGTDKNILIAGYATNFEKALRASLTSAAPLVSSEQPETTNDPPEPATPAAEPTESGAAENATVEDGSLSPQIVAKERPSLFTRIMTGILGTLGTAFGSVAAWFGSNEVATRIAEKGGERIVENAGRSDLATLGVVLLYIVGIGGVGVFFLWLATKVWEKSSERAKELNVAKISAAASKEKNTVEFSST